MSWTLVILAAGKAQRYGGKKQIDAVGPNKEVVMDYAIYDAIQNSVNQIVVLIDAEYKDYYVARYAKLAQQVDLHFQSQTLVLTKQFSEFQTARTKPWGTGHALLCCRALVQQPMLVVNGDDYYHPDTFSKIKAFLSQPSEPNQFATVLFPALKTLSKNGSVSRGWCTVEQGWLKKIEEKTGLRLKDGVLVDATEQPLDSKGKVSMNFWLLKPLVFELLEQSFLEFLKLPTTDAQTEFYLPTAIQQAIQNKRVTVKVFSTNQQWQGLTYQPDRQGIVPFLADLHQQGLYPDLSTKLFCKT